VTTKKLLRSVYTELDRGVREGMVEIKQTKVVHTERDRVTRL